MVIEDITEVPLVRITLFWDVTQTFRLTDFSGQPVGELIGRRETSVRSYHYTLRNIRKQRRSRLLRGVSLKTRSTTNFTQCTKLY